MVKTIEKPNNSNVFWWPAYQPKSVTSLIILILFWKILVDDTICDEKGIDPFIVF
jgi:hypothetical protein